MNHCDVKFHPPKSLSAYINIVLEGISLGTIRVKLLQSLGHNLGVSLHAVFRILHPFGKQFAMVVQVGKRKSRGLHGQLPEV